MRSNLQYTHMPTRLSIHWTGVHRNRHCKAGWGGQELSRQQPHLKASLCLSQLSSNLLLGCLSLLQGTLPPFTGACVLLLCRLQLTTQPVTHCLRLPSLLPCSLEASVQLLGLRLALPQLLLQLLQGRIQAAAAWCISRAVRGRQHTLC